MTTDSEGNFTCQLPTYEYIVKVFKEGYSLITENILIEADIVHNFTLEYPDGVLILDCTKGPNRFGATTAQGVDSGYFKIYMGKFWRIC